MVELAIAWFVIAVLLWVMVPEFIGSQNLNDEKHFPDRHFHSVVARTLGSAPMEPFTVKQAEVFDGTLRYVTLSGGVRKDDGQHSVKDYVKSLQGIELLKNLSVFEVNTYGLETIDVSHNKNLRELRLKGNYFDDPEIILPEDVDVDVKDQRMGREKYKKLMLDTVKRFRSLIGTSNALTKEQVDEYEEKTLGHLSDLGLVE